MKIMLSIIKAGIGSIGSHIAPLPRLLETLGGNRLAPLPPRAYTTSRASTRARTFL
jgi:hypothetical protein